MYYFWTPYCEYYDGSWHTLVHSSNYAVGCIIFGVLTGYIIDLEMMWKFCYACDNAEHDIIQISPELKLFIEGHKK